MGRTAPTPEEIALFRSGDRQASKNVHEYFYRSLYNFVNGIIKDSEESEDIVADTFVKLLKGKEDFKSLEHIKAFLFKIARRLCISYLRRVKVKNKFNNESRFTQKGFDDAVYEGRIRVNLLDEIDALIETLPIKCREVFLLSYKQKLNNEEIAHLLNIEVQSVRNQKGIAVKLLHKKLKDKGYLGLVIWFWLYLMR